MIQRDLTQTTYFILLKATYNIQFHLLLKTFTSVISSQTFSMQLGAGTMYYCLSQYAIPLLYPFSRSENLAIELSQLVGDNRECGMV